MSDTSDKAPLAPIVEARPPRRPSSSMWGRIVRVGVGALFLVLGVLGLFLPVLQGILFLAIGAALLAPDVPPARRALLWMYRRWPRLRRAVPRRFRKLGRPEAPQPSTESDESDEPHGMALPDTERPA